MRTEQFRRDRRFRPSQGPEKQEEVRGVHAPEPYLLEDVEKDLLPETLQARKHELVVFRSIAPHLGKIDGIVHLLRHAPHVTLAPWGKEEYADVHLVPVYLDLLRSLLALKPDRPSRIGLVSAQMAHLSACGRMLSSASTFFSSRMHTRPS